MWLDRLQQDLSYAVRQLINNKGSAFVVILTLALGIGANTAIFTLIDAVMLKSLPVTRPGELYRVGDGDNCCVISGIQGAHFTIFSYPLYIHLRDHTAGFSEMSAFAAATKPLGVTRAGYSLPASFAGELVSGNYFSTLGILPYAGRLLSPADDMRASKPVVVMSYRAWQQEYGSDPTVIGGNFSIDSLPVTVAGIAPPGFFGETLRANPPDFWIPLAAEPALLGQNSLLNHPEQHWLYIIGRFAPGAHTASIEARLNVELRQWLSDTGVSKIPAMFVRDIQQQHVAVVPAGGGVETMRAEYDEALGILTAISALVLLIACANVANLLLARAARNRIQTSVRLALGAARSRLIRQTVTESVVLALLGGAAGVGVSYLATRAILLFAFRGARYVPIHATPSLPVLLFAFLISLATGLAFGVVPAWIAARTDPGDALRGAGRSTTRHSTLPQKSLVVVQCALSCVLLCGAGLLSLSLRNLEHQQFGFQPQNRLVVRINPAAISTYTPEHLAGLYQELQRTLEQIPGVKSASYTLYSPVEGGGWSSGIAFAGQDGAHSAHQSAAWDRVSPHYFESMGIPLLRGRAIDERDTPGAAHVAVVSEAFANKYLKNETPIGKRFGFFASGNFLAYEIVGVAGDAKYLHYREAAMPMFYLPYLQMSAEDWRDSAMVRSNYLHAINVRLGGRVANIEPILRQAIASVDPKLNIIDVRSFGDRIAFSFNQERLIARLTTLFGLLALTLASVGLYGVTAYSVARRTSEIGLRMALGAARGEVIAMVLRDAMLLIALGLIIGIPVTISASRLLSHQLYGVTAANPFILAGAIVLLAASALVAGVVPAHRAARIDPMQALRTE